MRIRGEGLRDPLIHRKSHRLSYARLIVALFIAVAFCFILIALTQDDIRQQVWEMSVGDTKAEAERARRREEAEKADDKERDEYERRQKEIMEADRIQIKEDKRKVQEMILNEQEDKRVIADRKSQVMKEDKLDECRQKVDNRKHTDMWDRTNSYVKMLKDTVADETEEPTSVMTTTTEATTPAPTLSENCPVCKIIDAGDVCKHKGDRPTGPRQRFRVLGGKRSTNGLLWDFEYTSELPKFKLSGCGANRKRPCDLCCPIIPELPGNSNG